MPKRKLSPGYLRHKVSNRAFVRLDGRNYYMGRYGSDESHEKYRQIIQQLRDGTFKPTQPRKPNRIKTYLISCGPFFKVGIAADPESRVGALQTGNPFNIRLVSVIDGNHETPIHKMLDECRVRGEWFDKTHPMQGSASAWDIVLEAFRDPSTITSKELTP